MKQVSTQLLILLLYATPLILRGPTNLTFASGVFIIDTGIGTGSIALAVNGGSTAYTYNWGGGRGDPKQNGAFRWHLYRYGDGCEWLYGFGEYNFGCLEIGADKSSDLTLSVNFDKF